MLKFKPISITDKAAIDRYLQRSGKRSCDYAFANLFSWKHFYRTEWCESGGYLIFRFHISGSEKIAYLEPLGDGDIGNILKEIKNDAESFRQPLRLAALSDSFVEKVKALPVLQGFHFYKNRDLANYVYAADALRNLPGKKFHSKRNHIAKFEQLYTECKPRALTKDDYATVREILDKWASALTTPSLSVRMEGKMIETAFQNFEVLGLRGTVLCANGKAAAFSFGSMLNGDTFCVHVEKASDEYEGAFTKINQATAQSLPESVRFINREEDLGILNLRKAKLSYHPDELLSENSAFDTKCEEADAWKLWQQCFPEDDDTFMASYIYPYSDEQSRVLLYDGGELAAMFHVHSFISAWGQVGYMYGLGTDPAKRGKGLACKVIIDSLKRQKEQGNIATWVIQENKGFQGWQHRLGFGPSGKETMRFTTPDGFDFGGDPVNDWGLCRILDAEKYLQRYAETHPAENSEFFLEDPIFSENSGTYALAGGKVRFSAGSSVPGRESLSPQHLLEKYRMDDGTELKYIVVPGQR